MSKDIMTAEREIINAKFISNQFDDDWRLEQFLSSLVQADFNYKISYWLSKPIPDKIDDDELYIRAHEFRKRHYSAHRMHLCLQARYVWLELFQKQFVFFIFAPFFFFFSLIQNDFG